MRANHWKRRTQDSFVFNKNIPYLISVNIAIFVCIPCLKVSSKYLMMTKCPIPVCKTVCDFDKPSCTEWHWRGRIMSDNMTLDRGSYRVFQTLFLNLVVSFFFFSANPHLNRSPRFPHLRRTNRGQMWATYDKSKWNDFSTFKKNKWRSPFPDNAYKTIFPHFRNVKTLNPAFCWYSINYKCESQP